MNSDHKKQIKESSSIFVDILFARIFWLFIGIFLYSLILGLIEEYFKIGYDNTDGSSRSGLIIHTDCLTGVQYLTTSDGGLTSRISEKGDLIISRKDC